jgi:HK97 family phage major capsid protein
MFLVCPLYKGHLWGARASFFYACLNEQGNLTWEKVMNRTYETEGLQTKALADGALADEALADEALENGALDATLMDLKESIGAFCKKQETKMNQLWAAVGGAEVGVHNGSGSGAGSGRGSGRGAGAGFGSGAPFNRGAVSTQSHKFHTKGKVMNTIFENKDESLNAFIKTGFQTKSLSTSDDTGAYLMPHPVQDRIQQELSLSGSIRGMARLSSISGDALEVMLDGKASEVGWVSEKGARDETKAPVLVRSKIPVHEVYAKPMISQKLLDDAATNVEEWLIDNITASMNRLENNSFVNGDGEGKPMGFLSYAMVPVGQGAHSKIETVKTGKRGVIDSLDALYLALEAMKPEYLDGAVWYMSRSALTQIRRLKTMDGMPIWQASVIQGQPDTLLGYPVVLSDDMPMLREGEVSVSMALANFKAGYQVVDRADIRMLRDPYSSKPFVEFYVSKRVGGDVIDFDAFKTITFGE